MIEAGLHVADALFNGEKKKPADNRIKSEEQVAKDKTASGQAPKKPLWKRWLPFQK
jgi:hypothetical protein